MENLTITDHMLIEIGCNICNVMPFEVTSDSNDKKIVNARYLCYWLLYKYTALTYKDIGLLFNKSERMVSLGVSKIKSNLIFKDAEERTKLTELALMAGEIVSTIIKQNKHGID